MNYLSRLLLFVALLPLAIWGSSPGNVSQPVKTVTSPNHILQEPSSVSQPAFKALAGGENLNFSTISGSIGHTCVLTYSGGAKCWGSNSLGQLGDGTTTRRDKFIDVVGLVSGVHSIVIGNEHTCALLSSGGVKCWGANLSGEIGDGTTTDRNIPVDVFGLANGIIAIAAGVQQTCALTSGGRVKCWGSNSYGQLGDGTLIDRSTPVDVLGLKSEVIAITTGGSHTCALTSAGAVRCWGANQSGQLGDGTTVNRIAPVDVIGLTSGVLAISAGIDHTCALTSGGGVKCWGANGSGQLGDGTMTNNSIPVDVFGLESKVNAIAAGWGYTCALTTGARVKCWGENKYNQLGDWTALNQSTPVDVIGLKSDAIAISASAIYSCAGLAAGGSTCWGMNEYSRLADGSSPFQNISSDWYIEQAGSSIDQAGISVQSLRIDSNGLEHIVYVRGGGLFYAWRDCNGWETQRVSSATYGSSGSKFSPPSLALDSQDRPHISFHDTNGLNYAHWTGTSWEIQALDVAGLGQSSIAVDAFDHPHISYNTPDGLIYTSWTGSKWDSSLVDSLGKYSSVALDSAGNPHISYIMVGIGYDAPYTINYARWNGYAWEIHTLYDITGQFKTGFGREITLVIDSDDHPHISYKISYGGLDVHNYELFYAYWTGTRWSNQFLLNFEALWGVSMAVDQIGNPYIVYNDSHFLRSAHWNGKHWMVEIIGQGGESVSVWSSVDFDLQGIAHVLYEQPWEDNSGLYYAEQLAPPVLEKKVAPQTDVHPGETITYTLNVSAPWRSVLVTDTLPAQLEYITGTLSTSIAPSPVYSPTIRSILWQGTLTDTLQTIQFQVLVASSGDPASTPLVTNTARLSGPEHGRSASAFAILNGWRAYYPMIVQNYP